MSGSVNKVILIGNLGADPEIKSFQNGGKIANIRIATSENWKDRMTGERKERTEWHNVVINGEGLVGVVGQGVHGGGRSRLGAVSGQMGQRRAPGAHGCGLRVQPRGGGAARCVVCGGR